MTLRVYHFVYVAACKARVAATSGVAVGSRLAYRRTQRPRQRWHVVRRGRAMSASFTCCALACVRWYGRYIQAMGRSRTMNSTRFAIYTSQLGAQGDALSLSGPPSKGQSKLDGGPASPPVSPKKRQAEQGAAVPRTPPAETKAAPPAMDIKLHPLTRQLYVRNCNRKIAGNLSSIYQTLIALYNISQVCAVACGSARLVLAAQAAPHHTRITIRRQEHAHTPHTRPHARAGTRAHARVLDGLGVPSVAPRRTASTTRTRLLTSSSSRWPRSLPSRALSL